MLSWLKQYWLALTLIALLIALLDGMLSSLITCHPAGDKPNQTIGAQQSQECTALAGPVLLSLRSTIDFIDERAEAVVAVLTAVLACFTATLWWSSDKLWRVTNNTLTHAEETSRRELRAYIGVEPRGVKRLAGEDRLLGHVVIRNFGKIPAKNISIYILTDYYPDPTKMTFKIGELYDSKIALPPRAKMIFGAASVVDIDSIIVTGDGKADYIGFIFVYGKVTYTDEFNTEGWTEFCHRYPCKKMDGDSRINRKFARYHEIAGNSAG
jgi:hypothetical protein